MSVIDRIGNTPLVVIDDVLVKLECSNPSGSVKDRIAKFLLQEAARRGDLKPGDTVVEATSGNTGIAISMVARELGYKAIIYMPEHMSDERKKIVVGLGAEVRLTPREDGFEGPIRIRDTFKGKSGYYVPDQFSNQDNTLCHRLTTGAEILRQLHDMGAGPPGAFVAGVGTGGTLMGIGQALREAYPQILIVAVEPTESAVMSGGGAAEHGIQGIGDGFIPDLIDMSFVDEVVCISTEEAHRESERIRIEHGFCVGMSAGANMLSALKLRERGLTVVTVWPDCSNRYVSMGLEAPDSQDVTCPHQQTCMVRTAQLLGH